MSAHAIALAEDILGASARAGWGANWPRMMAEGVLELRHERDEAREILREIVGDYDRRRATRRGRFLLWLLRKVT